MNPFVSGTSLLLFWSLFVTAHLYFLQQFYYWHLVWLDVGMHVWGGVLLLVSWYYLSNNKIFPKLLSSSKYKPLIIFVIIIVGWEVFKYLIAQSVQANYICDTVIDLAAGLFGGLATFFLYHRYGRK